MKSIKNIICLTLCGLLFLNCSKDGEQGPIGPQGPQGEQGLAGPNGAGGQDGQDGEQGPQGEAGSANVIFSEWFPSEFPEDIASNNYVFSVVAPNLTSEIVETGVVLGYARFTSAADIGVVEQLPYSAFGLNQHYTLSFTTPPANNSGRVFISLRSMDGGAIGEPLFEEYRYVIIPGGKPAGANEGPGDLGSKNSSIDYTEMTYEEITAHFGIKD